jgi:hypothetical protein
VLIVALGVVAPEWRSVMDDRDPRVDEARTALA